MNLLLIFISWLIISIAIGIYGKIDLRNFFIYILTSLFFVLTLSCIFYFSWNLALYHIVGLFLSKHISTLSFYSSTFSGAITILIFALNYLWFKCGVRKSDKKDLSEVMDGIKEIRIYIEQSVAEIRENEKSEIERNSVQKQLINIREKLPKLEKLITPWLLRRF